MPLITVAVCCARPAPSLPLVLEALAAQGANPLVSLAGDANADLPTGARALRDPGPGLAHARNHALAACETEILALLDDDVVPAPRWLEALERAWAQGGDDLGALGGPLRLAPDAPRPGWLSDALLPALGTLDLGRQAHDLDPARRTLLGGNLAFRAAALRGIGGFWPARGHPEARDWFSEEHHAQRELGRAGWRLRYAPGVEAWRRPAAVDPRAFLAGRVRYGARLGLLAGTRRRPEAARTAARAALGLPLAARRPALLAERASRVAEGVGVLLAEPVAGEQVRPAGTATPFRATVPGGPPTRPERVRAEVARLRARREPAAAILLYHRVAEPEHDPLGLSVAPARFAEQLAALRAGGHELVALDALVAATRANRVPDRSVALTFDDGYADNLDAAAPLLGDVPATLFAATGHVEEGRALPWDELARLLLGPGVGAPVLRVTLDGDERAWRTASAAQRAVAFRHLHEWLQPQPPGLVELGVSTVRAWAGEAQERRPPAPPDARLLDVDGLRALAARPGFAVGAHTRGHVNLGHLPAYLQQEEIEGSRDDLEAWLGTAPCGFAYPFGVPGHDLTAQTRELVAAVGFDHAVVNAPGLVRAGADLFALPRLAVADLDGDAFAAWLRRAWR